MAIRVTGINSGMDTDSMVKDLVSAYSKKGENYTKEQTRTEWKQEAWKALNTKIKTFYNKYASNMRYSTSYNKKSTSVSDATKASVVTSDNAVNGTQILKVTSLASSGYLTGKKLTNDSLTAAAKESGKTLSSSTTLADLGYEGEKITISIGQGQPDELGNYTAENTKTFEVDGSTTISEFVKFAGAAGYNASFDESQGRIFISSKQSGADNDFNFIGGSEVTDLLGLTGEGSAKLDGTNAKITLNNADFESATNAFSINGLSITVKEKTTGEGISLSTDNDYSGVYDSIKEMFKEYNSLVNEMDKLYNADYVKSSEYSPLTSEEKEAMTDEEIEKWETKIKDSLLRNDSYLNKISSVMRTAMMQSFELSDGKRYSLSSFGINTLGYFNAADNERNAYHIDGDTDDDNTSGNSDKLKAMLISNPEVTTEFFQKLVGGLYDSMNAIAGKSDDSSSYGSFYNDKDLKNTYDEQGKKISSWEEYVSDIEERYYNQFAQMEKALTSINSQQSSISQLLGM